MEVSGEYLLSAQEYGDAMKVIIRDRRRTAGWFSAAFAVVVGGGLFLSGHPVFAVDALVAALPGATAWRIEAARATRAFKRRRGRTPTTVRFTEDGVTTTTAQGASAHRPWRGFSRVVETREVFVLHASNGYFLIVPKRPFSTVDVERISSLLHGAELAVRA